MKKLLQSPTLGGAPFTKEDLRILFQLELWDVIESTMDRFKAGLTPTIMSGMVMSGSGPYNITAGIVFIDGEFKRFPAVTGVSLTPPKFLASKAAYQDSRTMADASTAPIMETKECELAAVGPGGGLQSLTISASGISPNARYENKIFNPQIESPDQIVQDQFQPITLINGWAQSGAVTVGARIDSFGQIHLRGNLEAGASTNAIITAPGALPGPPATKSFVQPILTNTNFAIITVATNGVLSIAASYYNTANDYHLDGISYWTS